MARRAYQAILAERGVSRSAICPRGRSAATKVLASLIRCRKRSGRLVAPGFAITADERPVRARKVRDLVARGGEGIGRSSGIVCQTNRRILVLALWKKFG